jgi:hypothetical protein
MHESLFLFKSFLTSTKNTSTTSRDIFNGHVKVAMAIPDRTSFISW